jgi:hypothetical protein
MTSGAHREAYRNAKDGHVMDFDRIANEYVQWPMGNVAGLFLFACALTLVAVFLAHRYGNRPR